MRCPDYIVCLRSISSLIRAISPPLLFAAAAVAAAGGSFRLTVSCHLSLLRLASLIT